MRVPLDWLKEYVDVKMSAAELQEKLTAAGLEVVSVADSALGKAFEIEITSNRPDWLSLLGIAREVCAIQGKGTLKEPVVNLPKKKGFDKLFKISVAAARECPRYTARIIEGVNIEPSPLWLKKKVESMGLRSVCNVVDITNFVLFEYGQPLHVFDLDKIEGGTLLIRMAAKDEKILTIDGAERMLDKDILVIADSSKPVAIAGVMGGKGTEVSFNTKNILLESAYFNGPSIRRASRKTGLGTDSSYRFERGVDWQAVTMASDRAAQLICRHAGGRERKEFFDSQPKRKAPVKIKLRREEIKGILGIEIKPEEIKKILGHLGISLKKSDETSFDFEVPSYRRDLKQSVDLIEEIARIFGYDKIPVKIPLVKANVELEDSLEDRLKNIVSQTFVSLGFNEINSYSLINRNVLRNLRIKTDNIISICNPLSSETEILRPMLLPGIVQNLSYNLNRRAEQVKIFELAHVYFKKAGKIEEKLNLAFGLTGLKYIYDWQHKPRQLTFFDAKGVVETLLEKLEISDFKFSQEELLNLFEAGRAATVICANKKIGYMGEICQELLGEFDCNGPLFVGELFFEPLLALTNLDKKFEPFSTYPFILRDAAILIDEKIPAGHIVAVIKKTGKELIKDIKLFDRYAGEQIPKGFVSLAFSIKYQSEKETLTDQRVNEVHSRICHALGQELKAEIR